MTVIYFRVDGNSNIATGHIMRCLAIARACAEKGRRQKQCVQISFVVSDSQSRSLLEERFETPEEFAVHTLNSDYQNMEAEVSALLSYIVQKTDVDSNLCDSSISEKPWLLVDSYYASPSYFNLLSTHCKIAYLDDLKNFDCPVDLIINYDTDQDCSCYDNASQKLLGRQYTPLRTQFVSVVYNIRPEAAHVLLSTGGTDPYGVAEHLLHLIFNCHDVSDIYPSQNTRYYEEIISSKRIDVDKLKSLHYHIITSSANTQYGRLLSLAESNSHIHIHENVTEMASLMASCDLAVSAGGTTLSELCTVGVPTISYLMADNQQANIADFAAKGIIPYAGDIRPLQTTGNVKTDDAKTILPSPVISNILHFMTHMSSSVEARQKSSHAMRAFLDGRGAERIADTLLSF